MIYFIRQNSNGPVKIGVSVNPERRLLSMQTINPDPLHIMKVVNGSYAMEALLHEKFSDARINGEWFEPTEALLAYIENLRNEKPEGVKVKYKTKIEYKYKGIKGVSPWFGNIDDGFSRINDDGDLVYDEKMTGFMRLYERLRDRDSEEPQ